MLKKALGILLGILFFLALANCSLLSSKVPDISVEFKDLQVFEKNKKFEGLKVGGLSGLIFHPSSGYFYALSDDKTNHRYYKLSLSTQPHYRLSIKEQVFLKNLEHDRLTRNMDPEALVIYSDSVFFIASEGQQIYNVHEPTQIFTFDQSAVLKEAWPVPPVFWAPGKNPQPPFFGQVANKGFESLTLDKNSNSLWTATEIPLKQDSIFKQKSFVRLSAFDIKSKKLREQYAYALHNGQEGGLTALQWLSPKVFISLERVFYKKSNNGMANRAYIFLTDCRKASRIQAHIQLKKGFKPCSKKLLWDSSQQQILVDNLEGLALGPFLPVKKRWALAVDKKPSLSPHKKPKKQLMVLVSDNNFNDKKQKTQFLFFELHRGKQ